MWKEIKMKFSRRQYFKTTGLAASSLLVSTSYVNSDNWFSNIFKFNSKNNKDEVVGIPVESKGSLDIVLSASNDVVSVDDIFTLSWDLTKEDLEL